MKIFLNDHQPSINVFSIIHARWFHSFLGRKKNIPNSLIYSLSFQHTFIVFTESIENVVEKAPSVGADMIIIRLLMLNTVFFFFFFIRNTRLLAKTLQMLSCSISLTIRFPFCVSSFCSSPSLLISRDIHLDTILIWTEIYSVEWHNYYIVNFCLVVIETRFSLSSFLTFLSLLSHTRIAASIEQNGQACVSCVPR